MESIQHGAMALQNPTVSSDGKLRSGEEVHSAIASLTKATKLNTVHLMKEIKAYFDAERKRTSIHAERHSIVELRMKDVQFTPNSYSNLCAMISKSQTSLFGFHAGASASSYRRILERLDSVAKDSVQLFIERNFREFVTSAFNDVNLDPVDPKGDLSDHQAQTELVRFCTIVKAASVDEERRGTKTEEKQYYDVFNHMDFDGENKIQEKANAMLSLSQRLKDKGLDHGVDQYVLLALSSYIGSGHQFLTRVFPNRGGGYETMRGSLRAVVKDKVYENPQEPKEDEIYMAPRGASAQPPDLPPRPEYDSPNPPYRVPTPKPRSGSSVSGGSTSSNEMRQSSELRDRPIPAPRKKSLPSNLPPLHQVRDSMASINLNEPTQNP